MFDILPYIMPFVIPAEVIYIISDIHTRFSRTNDKPVK